MSNNFGFQIKPIPDETFFGLTVATGILAGFETYSQAYRGLLGKCRTCPSSLLPRGLNKLSGYLPDRFQKDIEILCDEHTAFPYFHHFSKPEALSRVKEAMISDRDLNIHNAIGLTNTSIKESQRLKYCSACANEQWALWGRATWLRSHQLPGVNVCYRHGLPLIESSISTVRYGIHSGEIQLPPISESPDTHDLWSIGDAWDQDSPNRLIAQLSHELLYRRPDFCDPRIRGKTYRTAFIAAGYRKGNIVDWLKVAEALREKYGDLIPRKLGLDFAYQSNSHWIHQITASQQCIRHPLQHILIIGTMFKSFDHMAESMADISKRYLSRKLTLPALPAQDTNMSKLTPGKSSNQLKPKELDRQKLAVYRQYLVNVLSLHPLATRSELRIRSGYSSYEWLLCNDREWVESKLPPKAVINKKKKKKKDWAFLDKKLAAEISKIPPNDVVRKFKSEYVINNAHIARITDISYFFIRKLITFPQTNAALSRMRLQVTREHLSCT